MAFSLKKNELFRLNDELFKKAEKYQLAYEELKQENMRLNLRIEELMFENEKLLKNKNKEEPLKNLEEKMIGQIKTDNPIDYGAKTIGKIVISAAQYCNKIASLNTADSKELVNLILGRTEVAKAEILKILELEEDPEAARKLIEQEKNATEDYFNSVRAQIENF